MRLSTVCLLLLLAGRLAAQSLVGTWVSTEPILVNVHFSLTFGDAEYLIDCTLGQTLGTWYSTDTQIHFTPTRVGINSGDVGKNDIWNYRFLNEDAFQLTSGPISVHLTRKKTTP
jgi:hypothetical protein